MTAHTFDIKGLDHCPFMPVFGAPAISIERGSGTEVWDTDGNRYLDFLSGIAVVSLGHANPVIADAICRQANTLLHVSNFFTNPQATAAGNRIEAGASGRGSASGGAGDAARRRGAADRAGGDGDADVVRHHYVGLELSPGVPSRPHGAREIGRPSFGAWHAVGHAQVLPTHRVLVDPTRTGDARGPTESATTAHQFYDQ